MNNTSKLFTIGFTKKTAKDFFAILKRNNVNNVIDIRLNNSSQLAGFTKGKDLEYFLKEISGIAYTHMPEFAPTKEILDNYKKKRISWDEYEKQYLKLLLNRDLLEGLSENLLNNACLLCSEPTSEKCHRRLLAEFIAKNLGNIDIIHL